MQQGSKGAIAWALKTQETRRDIHNYLEAFLPNVEGSRSSRPEM